MMENRRSVSESESHSHNSRTQRVPPTFTPLMARDTSDTLDSELHDLSGASRRSRYIEQGLVDPREAAGRHEIEDAQPPARWRFSWNDSFESEDQDDSRPLSDSERIYRISRGMARSSTRSLDDRHINNSSTRNLTKTQRK
ncbi:hypothetical protein L218DRAFT_548631 [Marasmius fiardii PR-910]|nr:hypothetical protein L218DRAFT_548631 [Marasmius fiardii PR-910]